MSDDDCNRVRSLSASNAVENKELIAQYAREYCSGTTQVMLLKLVGEYTNENK